MGVTNYYCINNEIKGDSASGYYLSDALGSTTGTTSTSAVLFNTYRYKPYGSDLSRSGASVDPKFLWVGQQGYRQMPLAHSSHYVRARTYSAQEAVWTTIDPYWPSEPIYLYAGSNPVRYIDPTGSLRAEPCNIPPESGTTDWVISQCGKFMTSIKWRDYPNEDGWIVQKIERKSRAEVCYFPLVIEKTVDYFEAWPVKKDPSGKPRILVCDTPNPSNRPDDTWGSDVGAPGSKFHEKITGTAVFIKGTPAGFTKVFKCNNSAPGIPSGDLHTAKTWSDWTKYSAGAKTIQTLSMTAECCCPCKPPRFSRSPSRTYVTLIEC